MLCDFVMKPMYFFYEFSWIILWNNNMNNIINDSWKFAVIFLFCRLFYDIKLSFYIKKKNIVEL